MSAPRTETYAGRVVLMALQLAVVAAFVRIFRIDSAAFFRVLVLATGGFIVHALSPPRFRMPVFAGLSIVSVVVAIGVEAGAIVLAAGVALLVLCHLPVAFRARVALILAAGVALAAARAAAPSSGVPALVWPALASMFMFRTALYLYSLRSHDAEFSPGRSLSFFFMMPNVCFPLYPVVDYKTFVGAADPEHDLAGYERGMTWVVRGLMHLMAYRLVFFLLAPREVLVYDLGDVIRFILSSVLLYLNVSGRFHIIAGLLYLFGFRLPETHRLFLLATGFADYWRRINTYWRDFVLKLVYYPTFVGLRGRSATARVLVSVLAVFVGTWMLHSYQYFWINGVPLLSAKDVLFWTAFGLLVGGATLRALHRGRAPAPVHGLWSASRAAKTVWTFVVIALLWSMWTANSIRSWIFTLSRVSESTAGDWMLLAVLVIAGGIVAGFSWGRDRFNEPLSELTTAQAARSGIRRLVALGALCLVQLPTVNDTLPWRLRQVADYLGGRGLLVHEEFGRIAGYYEELVRPLGSGDAVVEPVEEVWRRVYQSRGDFLMNQLKPNVAISYLGNAFSTNSHGLRDREYGTSRGSQVIRIGIIGPSDVLGAGVADGETFEALAELRLDSLARRSGRRVEILNLAFPAWTIAQRAMAIPALAAPFDPDIIILVVNPYEPMLLHVALRQARERGISIPDSVLAELVEQANVEPGMDLLTSVLRLRTIETAFIERSVDMASSESRRLGAALAILTLGSPRLPIEGSIPVVRRSARRIGIPVLECAGIWKGRDAAMLSVSEQDGHPNAAGHRLISRCFEDRLIESNLLPR